MLFIYLFWDDGKEDIVRGQSMLDFLVSLAAHKVKEDKARCQPKKQILWIKYGRAGEYRQQCAQ